MASKSSATSYAGGVALAALGTLAAIYHDRALFDAGREDIVTQPGWPLVGNLPIILQWKDFIHDFLVEAFTFLNEQNVTVSALGIPRIVGTVDPRNVEHVLKNNFENYVKGPIFRDAMNDLFGHGIFNANGEDWRYQRKTASHIFQVKNFRDHFTKVFVQEIEYMNDHIWDKAADENQVMDFHDTMFKFTLDSFILLGFGVNLNALDSKEKLPFAYSFDEAQKSTFLRFLNPLWPMTERIQKLLTPWRSGMRNHLHTVDQFAREVIEQRRQEMETADHVDRQDLLSRFMHASNADGEPLSTDELRDIVLNFVIAGRDTTAQALSWTFYMLMCHPRVERKLYQEILDHIDDSQLHDPPALYEAIKDMKYAHAVFYEVLRLYPSVPVNEKYALDDDIWPDGTHIRKGDYILWAPYAQGRSTNVWGPDAKEFKPERWFTETGDLKRESQGQWPAFHAGPRTCLGQHLATLEALVAIVFLIKRYKFSLASGQEITYQISLTLPMKHGMKVVVEKRRQ